MDDTTAGSETTTRGTGTGHGTRWAVVEQMGRRTFVGQVTRVDDLGVPMLRIVTLPFEEKGYRRVRVYASITKDIAPSSLYALTEITEEKARALANRTTICDEMDFTETITDSPQIAQTHGLELDDDTDDSQEYALDRDACDLPSEGPTYARSVLSETTQPAQRCDPRAEPPTCYHVRRTLRPLAPVLGW